MNEIPLQYEETGSGDVVLFVHGAISDRRVWTRYRDAIAGNRRFVAYDQRHFGESRQRDVNALFSADAHAGDLIGKVVWQENGRTLPAYLSAPPGNIATCERLSGIQLPTLVVEGSSGHIYDSMMSERVVECQPRALLVTMQGVN